MNILTETERIQKLVHQWCPESCANEPFELRLMRAFLCATACAADQHRVLTGQQCIRPLDSYPDPMQGFHNVPTGFIAKSTVPPPITATSSNYVVDWREGDQWKRSSTLHPDAQRAGFIADDLSKASTPTQTRLVQQTVVERVIKTYGKPPA